MSLLKYYYAEPIVPQSKYKKMMYNQLNRLAYLQDLVGGSAIPVDTAYRAGQGYFINPYFACIAAEAFLLDSTYYNRCRKWLVWLFDHISSEVIEGLTYCPTDWYISNTGVETNTKTGDSQDSYISMFLKLLWDYSVTTNDYSLITTYQEKWEFAGVALWALADNHLSGNDLTIAKTTYPIEYLMDNSESFAGFMALSKLMGGAGSQAVDWANRIAVEIESLLYKPYPYNYYDYALGSSTNLVGDWYPNVSCQIFPDLYYAYDNWSMNPTQIKAFRKTRMSQLIPIFAFYSPGANDQTYVGSQYPACEVWYFAARSVQEWGLTQWNTWCGSNVIDPVNKIFDAFQYRINLGYPYTTCADSGWAARACKILDEL